MKRIISILLAVVMLASLFTITGFAASKYSDVDGHWGQSYVEYYSEQGVVNGYPAKTETAPAQEKWVCKVCGYVHEGPLPEDFICPWCKHPASDFERVS